MLNAKQNRNYSDFELPTFNATKVTWDKRWKLNGHIAETDLGGDFTHYTHRMWNDSDDIGFKLHSPKTGRTIIMVMTGRCEGPDGVHSWFFTSREGISVAVRTPKFKPLF